MLETPARDLLTTLGTARTPDAGAAERAWLQMQQRIVDGPPPMDIGPVTAVHDRGRPRWIAIALGVAAIATAAALAIVWSTRSVADLDAQPLQSAPYSSDTAPAPSESTPAVRVDPIPEPTPTPSEVASAIPGPEVDAVRPRPTKPARRDPVASPAVDPTPAPAPTTSLAAEMRLLGQANAAMRKGDAKAALAKLDEHLRDFANGQLAPERDAARAAALCELGRRDAARKVVDAFVRAHPSSPLRSKIEDVCRD